MKQSPTHSRKHLDFYLHDEAAALRFQLAGDLSHEAAGELEQARLTAWSVVGSRRFTIDVSALQSVDQTGNRLLREWAGLGAELVVSAPASQRRLEQITGLPIGLTPRARDRFSWLKTRTAALCFSGLVVLIWAAATVGYSASAHISAAHADTRSSTEEVSGVRRN